MQMASMTLRQDITDSKALDRELFNVACEVAHSIPNVSFLSKYQKNLTFIGLAILLENLGNKYASGARSLLIDSDMLML